MWTSSLLFSFYIKYHLNSTLPICGKEKGEQKDSLHWKIKAQVLRRLFLEGNLGEDVNDLRSNPSNNEVTRLIPLMWKRDRITRGTLDVVHFEYRARQQKQEQQKHQHLRANSVCLELSLPVCLIEA